MNETVRLQFSLGSDLLILVKLTAAAIATKVGLDIDEMEDFRLASYELCASAIGGKTSGSVEVIYEFSESELTCTATVTEDETKPGRTDLSAPVSELSKQIIEALVDDYQFAGEEGRSVAWLSMRLDAIV